MCPQERLVIISKQTGLSFVLKRIGPLAAIITLAFYLLVLYSSAISKPPENLSVSIYSESFIETACQHLLLLVGFDTLIYRKYYDTPPILVGHQPPGGRQRIRTPPPGHLRCRQRRLPLLTLLRRQLQLPFHRLPQPALDR